MTVDPITLVAVITSVGAAAIVDLRTRRIPNAIPAAAAALGLTLGAAEVGTASFSSALTGLAVGGALLLPGYLMGGTGAGDVKLLAAQGALMGVSRVLAAFVYGAIAGGVLALAYAAWRGQLRATGRGMAAIAVSPAAGRELALARSHNRFPYGPAIAVGSVLAAVYGA